MDNLCYILDVKNDHIIMDRIQFIDIKDLHKLSAFTGGPVNFSYAPLRYPFLNKLRCFRYRCYIVMGHITKWVFFPV
jgi:hypothetical protein